MYTLFYFVRRDVTISCVNKKLNSCLEVISDLKIKEIRKSIPTQYVIFRVSQKFCYIFGYVRHISALLDDLAKFIKVTLSLGPISNPTPPTAALTEFFHADTVASDQPLPVSWYLISSVCVYLCSCMHIMSILCSSADAISSGSCPILFKVLTLNVAICSVCLHFSSFDCLSSVADFSNTEARALRKYNLEWWQLHLTETPEQQSSHATAPPMLVKKLN